MKRVRVAWMHLSLALLMLVVLMNLREPLEYGGLPFVALVVFLGNIWLAAIIAIFGVD